MQPLKLRTPTKAIVSSTRIFIGLLDRLQALTSLYDLIIQTQPQDYVVDPARVFTLSTA